MELTIGEALQRGVTAHREGKLEEARHLYQAILRAQPDHPEANHNLGVLAVSAGNLLEALPLFRLALQKNPKLEQFWLSYIEALIISGQFSEANDVLASEARAFISKEKLTRFRERLQQIERENTEVFGNGLKLSRRRKRRGEKKRVNKAIGEKVSPASRPSEDQIANLMELYQSASFAEAETLAASLTELFPRHPIGWKVLGSALQKQGKVVEALIAKERVLDLLPRDAEAHNNLGNALQEASRFAEAEERFRRAIELNAHYAEAFSNLGNTLRSLERLEEALAACAKAIALQPNYAPAHCNMGNALKDLERFDEAAKSYEQAVKLDPNYATAHNNLGVALQELGRIREAETSYVQAILLDATLAAAYNNLATVHMEMGKLDAAETSYYNALKIAPKSAEILRNFSDSRIKFDLESGPIQRMQEVYRDPNSSDDDRCQICFALAKVSQDREDFASAFQYFVEGNSLRKRQLDYDVKTDIELFADLKTHYLKIAAHAAEPKTETGKITPIFIVGMPRSGTTLVEQIISSHPQVTGAGELPFVTKLGGRLARGLADFNQDSLQFFREQYLSALEGVAEGNVLVTDKMPQNFRFLGLISLALPEAKIVHVRRAPAAVCWANYAQYFSRRSLGYPYDLDDIIIYYQLYEELMAFWKRALSIPICDVDYELLTVNQEEEIRRLIEQLDLDWDKACLSPENNNRRVATASNSQVREKIYQGSSARWKHYRPYLDGAFDQFGILE